MENSKMISLVVSLVVGIILVGSLVVPVVTDAQDGQKTTYTNQGVAANELDLSSDHTITVNVSTRTITVDSQSSSFIAWNPMIVSDGFALRAYSTSILAVGYSTAGYKEFGSATFTITTNGQNATITDGTTSSVFPCTWIYVASSDNPQYFMRWNDNSVPFYFTSEDQVKAVFFDQTNKVFAGMAGTDVTVNGTSATATITKTDVGHGAFTVGIGSSGGYSFTYNDTVEYPQIAIVPYSVTTDISPSGTSVYAVIPVMLLVSLLVLAVRFAVPRDD